MARILIVGVLAMAFGGGVGHAQEPCAPVADEVAIVSVAEQSDDYRKGLAPAFRLALTPRSFPINAIKRIEDPCTRGTFEAAGETYRVFGGFGDSPPRYALGPDPTKVVYVALGPPPVVALEWQKAGGAGGLSFRSGGIKILAITNGDARDIYALFDDVPGDAQLIAAFRDALEGRLPKIATFDAVRGTTTFAAQ